MGRSWLLFILLFKYVFSFMRDFFPYTEIQCIYDSEDVLHLRRAAGSCVHVHHSTQATPTPTARKGSPQQCGSGLEPTPGNAVMMATELQYSLMLGTKNDSNDCYSCFLCSLQVFPLILRGKVKEMVITFFCFQILLFYIFRPQRHTL